MINNESETRNISSQNKRRLSLQRSNQSENGRSGLLGLFHRAVDSSGSPRCHAGRRRHDDDVATSPRRPLDYTRRLVVRVLSLAHGAPEDAIDVYVMGIATTMMMIRFLGGRRDREKDER